MKIIIETSNKEVRKLKKEIKTNDEILEVYVRMEERANKFQEKQSKQIQHLLDENKKLTYELSQIQDLQFDNEIVSAVE